MAGAANYRSGECVIEVIGAIISATILGGMMYKLITDEVIRQNGVSYSRDAGVVGLVSMGNTTMTSIASESVNKIV